jgi:protein-tyrosine phosphatase
MAILEAMALGKPVVATAVGGVPEVVQHGVTGLLVEPGDEAALAGACLELARDRDRAKRLGAQGREVVAEGFSHERSGGALMDAYRSVATTHLPRTDISNRVASDRGASAPERQAAGRPAAPVGARADEAMLRVVPSPGRREAARFSTGRESRADITALGLCRGLARRLLDYGARTVACAVERRRMNLIRRNPAALKQSLRSAERLLVMCHGNIIRSPFAAHLLRQALAGRPSVSVVSAGLEAVPGKRAHPTALVTATTRRVDLSCHCASPVAPDRVTASDVIFVMDIPQLVAMRNRFPDARGKTFLLTCLAPELPLEIKDPINGDEAAFQVCYENISRAVRPIVRTPTNTPSRQ